MGALSVFDFRYFRILMTKKINYYTDKSLEFQIIQENLNNFPV